MLISAVISILEDFDSLLPTRTVTVKCRSPLLGSVVATLPESLVTNADHPVFGDRSKFDRQTVTNISKFPTTISENK